jgi:tetratricopeptide (TPR) repeat protein
MIRVFITTSSLLFLLSSCASPQYKSTANTKSDKSQMSKKNNSSQMKIRFQNQLGEMEYLLDPTDEDVAISMTGKPVREPKNSDKAEQILPPSNTSKPETVFVAPQKNPDQNAKNSAQNLDSIAPPLSIADAPQNDSLLRKVVSEIRKAQEFFYAKNYENALSSCEKANGMRETAEAYSLIGSIYYVKNQRDLALKAWIKALVLNPDLPSVTKLVKKLKGEN